MIPLQGSVSTTSAVPDVYQRSQFETSPTVLPPIHVNHHSPSQVESDNVSERFYTSPDQLVPSAYNSHTLNTVDMDRPASSTTAFDLSDTSHEVRR